MGLGHLLAQQLLSAGERVLDVQPKLGARVRLLASGNVNKNDPNDARSVAVAAPRSPGVREARSDDHAAVLKVWSKRHRDLGSSRTQVVCRLHAVLARVLLGTPHGASWDSQLPADPSQVPCSRPRQRLKPSPGNPGQAAPNHWTCNVQGRGAAALPVAGQLDNFHRELRSSCLRFDHGTGLHTFM